MIFMSRFEHVNGRPVEEQVEAWAQKFFFDTMQLLNAFFAQLEDAADTCERLAAVPFDDMVREELEGEDEESVAIATAVVRELFAQELEFIKAYAE
ncbi:MAG: hypothetical protein Q4B48_03955 [Syntrophomonadaceae bacterium]|nr:hypothetical protein [Syntrophomonadaceae bacterium]